MSIMSDKNTQGMGLQDIIDSYNRELMRIHSRTRPSPGGSGKQDGASHIGSPNAENDPPGSDAVSPAGTRPQSSFSLGSDTAERPDTAEIPVASMPAEEQERWLRELEEGLEELRKGLEELAKGQQELNEGLREWREGMSAGGMAVSAPAVPSGGRDTISPQESERWLGELGRGLEELRAGLKELAKGQKELSDGITEWKEGVSGTKYRGPGKSFPIGAVQGAASSPARQDNGMSVPPGNNTHEPAHNFPVPDEAPLNPPMDGIPEQPVGYGTLCVAVNTARQAMPIRGASVTVTLPVGDSELLYSFVSTDSSGRSPDIELPVYSAADPETTAPADEYTEYIPRFRTYRVRVQAAGFELRDDLMAEIFDGMSSTLTAELEPLPGGNNAGGGGEGM